MAASPKGVRANPAEPGLSGALAGLVESWLGHLERTRGIATNSRIAYAHDAREFLGFLHTYQGGSIGLQALGALPPRTIRAFLSERKIRGDGASTRNRKLSAIKTFFRYLRDEHGVENDALLMKRGARAPARLPRPLSEEAAREVIDATGRVDKRAWVRARDHALLLLLYASGMRISEALSLKRSELCGASEIRILGKGGKERMLPILPEIFEAAEQYLALCPHEIGPNDALFRGIRGQPMSARAAAYLMEKLRHQLGLPASATPHALRHSFASHLLAAGGDIRAVQKLLGHSSLRATQIYTKLDEKSLLEAYHGAHPKGDG